MGKNSGTAQTSQLSTVALRQDHRHAREIHHLHRLAHLHPRLKHKELSLSRSQSQGQNPSQNQNQNKCLRHQRRQKILKVEAAGRSGGNAVVYIGQVPRVAMATTSASVSTNGILSVYHQDTSLQV